MKTQKQIEKMIKFYNKQKQDKTIPWYQRKIYEGKEEVLVWILM